MDEQFESHMRALAPTYQEDFLLGKNKAGDKYTSLVTQYCWLTWQAALSQPAAQGDSSHPAGGECGGVQVPDLEACSVNQFSSRICENGTWGCRVEHAAKPQT